MRIPSNIACNLLLCVLLLVPAAAIAQQGAVSIDHVSCLFGADTVLIPSDMRITLRCNNNTDRRVDISNGFRIYSPDGVVWDSTTISETAGGTFAAYFDVLFHLGTHTVYQRGNDTVGILGAGTPTSPLRRLAVGYDAAPVEIRLWGLLESNNGKHICIDTALYSPGGYWKWVSVESGTEYTYYPTFTGLPGQTYSASAGYCFTLYHMPCGAAREITGIKAVASEAGCPCSVCCVGTTGNVNEVGIVDLSDLSALVAYLTGGGYILPCEEEANINTIGIVDLSDLSALVSYLTGGGYTLPSCL